MEGFPIRTSPGQRLFPPIRRLSQVTTSFIAFQCQGIRRVLLLISPKILIDPDTETSGAPIRIQLDRILDQFTFSGRSQRLCSFRITRNNYRRCHRTSSSCMSKNNQLTIVHRLSTIDYRPLVVELTGIEPVTSWLQTRRSPN